jgi:hypothetical protein
MNIQERSIEEAISYLKEKNAYSSDINDSLRKYLKAKFKYAREVIKFDPSWDKKGLKNHILGNIPNYGHELWFLLSSDIDNLINNDYYTFYENDITALINYAEESALNEYLKSFKFENSK